MNHLSENCIGDCDCSTVLEDVSPNFELKLEGLHVWHSVADEYELQRFNFDDDKAVIQLVFSLNPGTNAAVPSSSLVNLQAEENSILYIPEGGLDFSRIYTFNQSELFGVNMDIEFFRSVVPNESSIHSILVEKIGEKKPALLDLASNPLTMAMKGVIYQIMKCMRQDNCRCIFYQAKIMELLSLQLEQRENLDQNSHELKEEELRRIYQVKDMLESDPGNSFSLLGLAHAVGTNDATLKKHFKQVYGTTVFNYLNAYRMEKAKEMLLNRDCKISIIANQFGYKHATHFSAAFKKYFGYPPTKLKG